VTTDKHATLASKIERRSRRLATNRAPTTNPTALRPSSRLPPLFRVHRHLCSSHAEEVCASLPVGRSPACQEGARPRRQGSSATHPCSQRRGTSTRPPLLHPAHGGGMPPCCTPRSPFHLAVSKPQSRARTGGWRHVRDHGHCELPTGATAARATSGGRRRTDPLLGLHLLRLLVALLARAQHTLLGLGRWRRRCGC
jgi:hypothetical protein